MNENSGTTPKRLTRSSSTKVIAGVAGGLAEYTGLDPVIFRIGFIALAVAGGSGLLMYLLAWLVIPEEGSSAAPASGLIERVRSGRWLPLALIAIAVIILIETLGSWGGPGLWAIALIAIGIALLQDEREAPAAATREPLDADASRATDVAHVTNAAPALTEPRPRVRRRRSPLGVYTLGATLLVVATAVALTEADVFDMDLGQFLALGLVMLGAGLIVGAWWGRARLVVLAGFLVVPFMLTASILHVPLRGEVGDRYISGSNVQLEEKYELLAGKMQLDLSEHRFGTEPTEIEIDFVAGDVDVWVPPGVHVTTTGTLDVGVADLFGKNQEGSRIDLTGSHDKPGLTEGELILHIRGGFGSFDLSWANWIEDQKQKLLDRIEQRKEAADGTGSGATRERNGKDGND